MSASVSSTLAGIDKWATSIQVDGLDASRLAAKLDLSSASDLVQGIAESLIGTAGSIERKLLSKSLQEALFYCVGFDTEIGYPQFKTRFAKYLDREGVSSFILRFLSLYFFNFVWFETGECFRALAATSERFLRDMESVERICNKVVASTWKSFEKTQRPLNSSTAGELVRKIEQHLRGVPGLERR